MSRTSASPVGRCSSPGRSGARTVAVPRPKVDDATGQRISFSVVPAVTERIDRFLADQLQWSRTQAARFVAERLVEVDGRTARASRTLVRGDVVTIMPRGEQVPRNL